MRKYDQLIKKLTNGEVVYLLSKLHSTAIKCIPDTTHYKARKGGSEYDIESSTDLVCDAFEDIEELTLEDYLTY